MTERKADLMPDKRGTAILNAGDVRDLIRAMKADEPMTVELMDGTKIELIGGDPRTEEIGREHSDAEDLPTV